MSTVGVFSTMGDIIFYNLNTAGGYHDTCGGYHEYCGVFSTVGVLKISPTCSMIFPTVLNTPWY